MREDKVSVVCRRADKALEYEKRRGETSFLLEDDFWEWWKHAISFTEEDWLDSCFLYDREYSALEAELCLGEEEITPMAAYFRNQMKRERMEK